LDFAGDVACGCCCSYRFGVAGRGEKSEVWRCRRGSWHYLSSACLDSAFDVGFMLFGCYVLVAVMFMSNSKLYIPEISGLTCSVNVIGSTVFGFRVSPL
jgi:hypothetical protein